MRRRIVKISVLATLSAVAILLIVGAAFFWRLSQGPVALDFLSKRVEAEVNAALPGMKVNIGGVIFELDKMTGVPHVRLRDLVLRDAEDNLIARSERAAIGLQPGNLVLGNFKPQSIELIGTRLLIKRQLDGTVTLGFGTPAKTEAAPLGSGKAGGSAPDGKADKEQDSDNAFSVANARSTLDMLSGTNTKATTALLEDIRISNSTIQLYDEINRATWYAPQADLTFRRMPYGFVIFTKASVASGPTNWQTEISATYRSEQHSFAVSARIFDLIPANVADKVYALSKFARVNIPLSGHAEAEISDAGVVQKASFEFSAAAGVIDLPEYFANPIVIDEGALRSDYDPATGGFNIVDSILLVGGSRAELTGRIDPQRAADGSLDKIGFKLKASNVSVDTQGTVREPVIVDRVELAGKTAIDAQQIDIEDLLVMSGNAGVRLRGIITGGERSAGIQMTGRVRDISAEFLKKLWPPVVGPKSRVWIAENVAAGRIADGSLRVNIAPDMLADAKKNLYLPDQAIDFQFSMQDVSSRYFKNLPGLTNASGTARLQGNSFNLTIDKATVKAANGGLLSVRNTTFDASDLLAEPANARITINVGAAIPDLLSFAWEPDLNLFKTSSEILQRASGLGDAVIKLEMPLLKNLPKENVKAEASMKVTNGSVDNLMPGINVSGASLTIASSRAGIKLSGPVKINGMPAQVQWERAGPPGTPPKASLTATLSEDAQEKLGLKLGGFMNGPIKLAADFNDLGTATQAMTATADLSDADIRISALNWYRPPTEGTAAAFTFKRNADKTASIENLVIKGPGLSLKGNVSLGAGNSLRKAEFQQVWLSQENNFAMSITPGDGLQTVRINGASFDARPFVKSMFAKSPAASSGSASKSNLDIQARVDRIIAHRGELVTGAAADISIRNGVVMRAEINGQFLSGAPIAIRVRPGDQGRLLQVNSGDGGATLRAANLYSKVAGGNIEFSANLAGQGSTIQNGRLAMRDFAVRNESALAQVDSRGRQRKSGPRREGLSFKKLTMPFTSDDKFIRIGDTLLRGTDLGASASGIIRKSDGAIDITGTIIPAYELNAALGNIPVLGMIITGGKGQGIFGLTFALGGTFAKPRFQANPLSAITPGIFRKIFEFDGPGPSRVRKPVND